MESPQTNILRFLFTEAVDNTVGFFFDWFYVWPKKYWRTVFRAAKDFNRVSALATNMRLWISPLYQDYTPAGYGIGIVMRTIFIIAGLLFFAFFFLITTLGFVVWFGLPLAFVLLFIGNLLPFR